MAKKVKHALYQFLEEVESDKKSKAKEPNAEKLAKHMKENEESEPKKKGSYEAYRDIYGDQEIDWDKISKGTPDEDEPTYRQGGMKIKGQPKHAGETYRSKLEESSFSRQHYEAVAKLLDSIVPNNLEGSNGAQDVWDKVYEGMVEIFKKDNPRFDETRFAKACGLKDS